MWQSCVLGHFKEGKRKQEETVQSWRSIETQAQLRWHYHLLPRPLCFSFLLPCNVTRCQSLYYVYAYILSKFKNDFGHLRGRNRNYVTTIAFLICCLIFKCLQQLRLGQAKTGRQELILSCACVWQVPNHLSHFQWCHPGCTSAGSKVRSSAGTWTHTVPYGMQVS